MSEISRAEEEFLNINKINYQVMNERVGSDSLADFTADHEELLETSFRKINKCLSLSMLSLDQKGN